MRGWAMFCGLLILWAVLGAADLSRMPVARGTDAGGGALVVTTANVRVGLAPPAARADLVRAMAGSDVVLAQEMQHRRMNVRGWGRVQARSPSACRETPVYWRRAAMVMLSWRAEVLQRGSWAGATRCATLVKFRDVETGRVFVAVNVHQAQGVEIAGRPRPGRAEVYLRGMKRLDSLRAGLRSPYLIGGDWNVARGPDCRVRWHGFPCARLAAGMQVTRTRGTLGHRQVDYIWFGPAWTSLGARRITGTRSDHDFVRVRLGWSWSC